MRARTCALVAVATLALAAVADAQEVVPPSAPIDFSLEETSGQTRTMREVRGRVVVIFYEDREHTDLNREFKMTLHQFITDNQLRDQTTTYAVANVSSISGGVMQDMARTAIRAIAAQYGIQLLLDWNHTLEAAPISMRDGAANVALADRTGRIRWRHTGAIGEPERRSFFRAFRQLLREPAPTPTP